MAAARWLVVVLTKGNGYCFYRMVLIPKRDDPIMFPAVTANILEIMLYAHTQHMHIMCEWIYGLRYCEFLPSRPVLDVSNFGLPIFVSLFQRWCTIHKKRIQKVKA